MRRVIYYLSSVFLYLLVFLFPACSDDGSKTDLPLSAVIFHSIDGKQVAFTALTHSAVSWEWDFGDGNVSTEKDPVHVYEEGGYYIATLTAKDNAGNSVTTEVNLAVSLTPYALLTGNHTAEGYDGKTWKLTMSHTVNDKLVNSDANFSLLDEDIPSLPSGAFSVYVGLPEAYNDEFTFYYDGRYRQNTTDGSSFGGIVYAMRLQQMGGAQITKTGGEAVFGQDVFALTTYTSDENATFVLNENENFIIPTIPDFATGTQPPGIPVVTYPGVMTLDFPDSDAFIGIRDFHRKVIVQEITSSSMRLVMFLTLSPDAIVSQNPLIALSTSAAILTFEAVN
ncbi:PKD domain-containing protein [Porphyromonadaceae bacterium NLAE-zl-C104]|uniref:PKD domain-containing protein n=1 Tax=Proteiniphilum sp. TaxID=1926877 RepID=UPI0008E3060C|nr:PKD domain-containing protein [Proteiniphilum sp.]MDY9917909.1 PKD domain-containing protein [Proteiniphilum sp.]SFS38288.1 PKD domain-containing protein [Porphyromonadaceae bacterium NLAE-zl-C104]